MDNIIASAKREARRRTKSGGGFLQSHLDAIAREAGRSHWGEFLADPGKMTENTLDRLVREAHEEGYDGLEIDVGDHVPEHLGPIVVKAFRTAENGLNIDLFRLGWDDIVHLAPFIRKRFEKPGDNACWGANCGGRTVFLYNHLDAIMAFHFPEAGGIWAEVHDMLPAEAFERAGSVIGWWRGREGRSLVDVVADRELHRMHVRKLRQVVASPTSPTVRYDPFCSSVAPSHHVHMDLARAHFDAVAEIVVAEGSDCAEQRLAFSEIALLMKRRTVRCEWDERSAGLPDFSEMARDVWTDILKNEVPPRLQHIPITRLTSIVNQLTTKMQRFAQGPLARATDGVGEKLRQERAWMEWEDNASRAFLQAHPGLAPSGLEFDRWMSDARKEPGVPVRPVGRYYG